MPILIANRQDQIARIDEVENGLACNCTCIHCGQSLVAKNKGRVVAPYFAHYSRETASCHESSLHKLAKELISSMSGFRLKNKFKYIDSKLDFDGLVRIENKLLDANLPISHQRLEEPVLEGLVIADILAVLHIGDLLETVNIEIKVTNPITEEKLSRLVEGDITTLEIDLSGLYKRASYKIDDVRNHLLAPGNQIWKHQSQKLRSYLSNTLHYSMKKDIEEVLAYCRALKNALESNAISTVDHSEVRINLECDIECKTGLQYKHPLTITVFIEDTQYEFGILSARIRMNCYLNSMGVPEQHHHDEHFDAYVEGTINTNGSAYQVNIYTTHRSGYKHIILRDLLLAKEEKPALTPEELSEQQRVSRNGINNLRAMVGKRPTRQKE